MEITKENIKELVGRTIKSKDKSVHWLIKIKSVTFDTVFFETVKGNVGRLFEHNIDCVLENINSEKWILTPQEETPQHYDNTNGSLYLFAKQHELNAYEFDIIKRIVRCRKKGQFRDDLEKSIRVIELYLKEME
jgi:hypothetical protein